MSIASSIENWLYRVANPVVKLLLRSPLHGIASGNITLLHFRGRKSGREFVTPLSYVRENGTVCLMSAHENALVDEPARRGHAGFARDRERDVHRKGSALGC